VDNLNLSTASSSLLPDDQMDVDQTGGLINNEQVRLPSASRRSLAQHSRRERECQQREANVQAREQEQATLPPPSPLAAHPPPPPPLPPPPLPPLSADNDQHNWCSLGQQRCREREREQQQQQPRVNREVRALDLYFAACRPYVEPSSRHDLGRMNVVCQKCQAYHWMAEHLVASLDRNPVFGLCCNHGQVHLPPTHEPPQALKDLLEHATPDALEFQSNIPRYNAALAFTSLGVQIDHQINGGHGPYVFRIHGELCHQIRELIPSEGRRPMYAQLYIYDPEFALDARMQHNDGLCRHTIEKLQNVLLAHHRYAPLFRHAHELLMQEPEDSLITVRLLADPTRDHRRYNLPTVSEIAAVIPRDGAHATESRDIVLHRRSGPLHRISDGHRSYACLHYVLFFPYGEDGWHWDMQLHQPDKAEPSKLSQIRYTAYQLFPRSAQYAALFRGRALFQQYLVDIFASAEQGRLRYLRHNQDQLRASLYSGLQDALAGPHDDGPDLHEIGQRIVLLSSFTGGPRYMYQCYQDGLALAQYFKAIDIFMTVTCNPKWPEVQQELLPGQTAADHPDLVARVFHMKKTEIINNVYKNGVFGHTVAYIYTIEFQKHGLPHMHLLIFLEQPHKLLTPADIDTVIWARWPDPDMHPLLFETVKACMVHGPCGAFNPNAPCMQHEKCTKGYPKPFQEQTNMDHDGYPLYHRPEDHRTFKVGQHELDNRWIVPYNPFMSATFNCHINVECGITFHSLKYVNKYICKGQDHATMEISSHCDEIKQYIDGRYISAPEAVWWLFQFHIHEQHPPITWLQVHLPGQHMVVFNPNDDPEVVRQRAENESTTLTAFFKANADPGPLGVVARQYTYQEFPQHLTWKADKKVWSIRQKGFALGRMYYVGPTGGERFYLRTLLTVIKGARSFTDLRTFHGVVYPTFREACLAHGLLEDDREWELCLEDAVMMQTGHQLRQLFATILLFCDSSNPARLWNDFRQHICDDLQHRLTVMGRNNPSAEDAFDFGLYLLNKLLMESGHSLTDFAMPQPQHNWDIEQGNHYIAKELSYNRDDEQAAALANILLLNLEQADAFNRIFDSVTHNKQKFFFLSGPGGTGKTFVYKTVCHRIRAEGWIVLCVASSGIAALLMRGGQTAHSMFKIPIDDLSEDSFCCIPKEGLLAGLIRSTVLIIWDEITMQHRHALEAVDKTCRDIRDSGAPFGGITVVIGGDFQQILPVIRRGSRESTVDATVQHSYLWNHVEILRLKQNMRLDEASHSFAEWLLDIGHGRNSDALDGHVVLPEDMLTTDIDTLIAKIYGSIEHEQHIPPPQYFSDRMILAARNGDVDEINKTVLHKMIGDEISFFSADEVIHEQGVDGQQPDQIGYPVEFLRSLSASGLPPGELTLKVGCPLILLRNLAPQQGLCNGTRMVVLRMSNRILEVRILGGDHDGKIAFIPRISLIPSTMNSDFTFQFKRRQFPVRLAFAMTINKAQGQSVKYVGLDLRVPVFSHGQLYVALSRATSHHRISVLLPAGESKTLNVVYPEVLTVWWVVYLSF